MPNELLISNNDEVLKENIIYRQVIGSVFVPEIIPIINDKEGKEWICDANQMLNITVSADDTKNFIEINAFVKRFKRDIPSILQIQKIDYNKTVGKSYRYMVAGMTVVVVAAIEESTRKSTVTPSTALFLSSTDFVLSFNIIFMFSSSSIRMMSRFFILP